MVKRLDRPRNDTATRSRQRTPWIILVLLVLAGGALLWRHTRPDPVEVVVRAVSRGRVERTVANTRAGTVKACRRAKLSPGIGGQIARLPVREGDQVKEGALLLELWNDDLAAQVLLAEREVRASRARAQAVCSRVNAAVRNADRLAALLSSSVGTQERAENAAAEAASLKAECESVRREVLVREARLTAARAALERTRLRAPFDGVIGEINGERYEYVTPSPLGVPTPPVIDIIASGCFYVIAPIDEVDVADIRVGMPVRITTDAHGSRVFEGRVRRVADYVLDVEKQARTVDVEVGFSDPADFAALLAGYSADIEVIIDSRDDVVRVPTEAVMTDGSVYVFLTGPDRIERRPIRSGLANWDFTEVVDGLPPEARVVVNVDAQGLADGAPATVIEASP